MSALLRRTSSAVLLVAALFAVVGLTSGCSPKESTDVTKKNDHDDHDHDEHDDHDHGPAGPHGGHTESFDQPGYAFEWIHENDEQLVRIIVLDEAKKEAVKVAASEVTLTSTKGREPQTFTLPAIAPDAEGLASEFALKDGHLLVALNLGVDLSIEIDGATFTKKLEPHDHQH